MEQMQLVFLTDVGLRIRQEQIERAAAYRLAGQMRRPRTRRPRPPQRLAERARSWFENATRVRAHPAH